MKTQQSLLKRNVPGSFRDPSGHVFMQGGTYYRQINPVYKEQYDHLMKSGLYEKLSSSGVLISHAEEQSPARAKKEKTVHAYIRPDQIPFISYPYEWCFSQLKDAALLTLDIQLTALSYGMILKDASPYNIQFLQGKPVLIDTLSFDLYQPGRAWTGYKQFCEQFLAPLAIASYRDARLLKLLSTYPEGIPLDLARALLPRSAWLNIPLFLHLVLHSFSQKRYEGSVQQAKKAQISLQGIRGITDSLHRAVRSLQVKQKHTVWSAYYPTIHYAPPAFNEKKRLVGEFLDIVKPKTVLDVGANTGLFSFLATKKGVDTIAIDSDHAVIEQLYLQCKRESDGHVLPLCIDAANPTPGIGWENSERMSLVERLPVDMVFALAVLHHLCVTNNLPFSYVCSFFRKICAWLIIEYVPKEDEQFQKLLGMRGDIFPDYSQERFEQVFTADFTIHKRECIRDSNRLLYLMKAKD